MSKNYRTKPQNIKAVKWTGDNVEEVKEFLGEAFLSATNEFICFRSRADYYSSTGLAFFVMNGDYIYTEDGVKFWKKTAREFEDVYEEVNENE